MGTNIVKRPQALGIIDRVSDKTLSGWLMPYDLTPIIKKNIRVFIRGKENKVKLTCHERVDLNKFKDDNQFGCMLKFDTEITLDDLQHMSVFYYFAQQFIEITLHVSLFEAKVDKVSKIQNRLSLEFEFYRADIPRSEEIIAEINDELFRSDPIPVGTLSEDKVAIVGHQNYLFLSGGSNNVDAMYSTEASSQVVEQWHKVIDSRRQALDLLGVNYLQLLIPEKQTLLPQYYTRDIKVPSDLYNKVSSHPVVVDTLNELKGYADKSFYKVDSHINTQGAWCVFNACLKALNLEPLENVKLHKANPIAGDLANKLYPEVSALLDNVSQIPSNLFEYKCHISNLPESKPTVVQQSVPEGGGHIGRTITWTNPQAQFKKKVLVFGNSFFDFGSQQEHMSWWFAHYFSEFQFVWTPDVDLELVKKVQPDIVIAQTIERFLPICPDC